MTMNTIEMSEHRNESEYCSYCGKDVCEKMVCLNCSGNSCSYQNGEKESFHKKVCKAKRDHYRENPLKKEEQKVEAVEVEVRKCESEEEKYPKDEEDFVHIDLSAELSMGEEEDYEELEEFTTSDEEESEKEETSSSSGNENNSLTVELSSENSCGEDDDEVFYISRTVPYRIIQNGEDLKELRKALADLKISEIVFLEPLSSGVFGSVYKCRIATVEGIELVVKLYHNQSDKKKKNEKMFERDSFYIDFHPNIVPVLSHCTGEFPISKLPNYNKHWEKKVEGGIYRGGMIISQYICKTDLKRFLLEKNKKNDIPMNVVMAIIGGILRGLEFLGQKRIVHRDLHCGNVLFDPESLHVWICDFGHSLDLHGNRYGFEIKYTDFKKYLPFSFEDTNNSGNSNNSYLGGWADGMPPEIRNFDKNESEYIDYKKYDVYSAGKILEILKYSAHRSDSDPEEWKFVHNLALGMVCEDKMNRICCSEALEILNSGKFPTKQSLMIVR